MGKYKIMLVKIYLLVRADFIHSDQLTQNRHDQDRTKILQTSHLLVYLKWRQK